MKETFESVNGNLVLKYSNASTKHGNTISPLSLCTPQLSLSANDNIHTVVRYISSFVRQSSRTIRAVHIVKCSCSHFKLFGINRTTVCCSHQSHTSIVFIVLAAVREPTNLLFPILQVGPRTIYSSAIAAADALSNNWINLLFPILHFPLVYTCVTVA